GKQSAAKTGMQDRNLRIPFARLLPLIQRLVRDALRKVKCSEKIVCACILQVALQSRPQDLQVLGTAGENVTAGKLRRRTEIVSARLTHLLPAISPIISDQRMSIGRELSRFALIGNRR